MKCIQCGSEECGPYRCRFSDIKHDIYRWNLGADLVKRDQAARHEGRPEHDMRCDGMPLKAGS